MALLKNRDFTLFLSGQLISTFGNNVYALALPWYVFTVTHSKGAMAATGVAETLPMLFGFFSGVLVDRVSKKFTMITSDTARAMIAFLMFLISIEFKSPLSIIFLVVCVIFLQLAGTLFDPAAQGLMQLLIDPKDINRATSLRQSVTGVVQFVGFISGGYLLSVLGAPLLFSINAVSFLVSAFSIYLLRMPQRKPNPISSPSEKTSLYKDWTDGLRFIFTSRFYLHLVVVAMVANGLLAPFDIVVTTWVKVQLGGNASILGGIVAALFVGMVVGSLFAKRLMDRLSFRFVSLMSMIGFGICMSIEGVFRDPVWSIAITLVAGVWMAFSNAAFTSVFLTNVPQHMSGRFFSTFGVGAALIKPLAIGISGFLLAYLPLPWMWLVLGSGSIVCGLSFIVLRPQKDAATVSASA